MRIIQVISVLLLGVVMAGCAGSEPVEVTREVASESTATRPLPTAITTATNTATVIPPTQTATFAPSLMATLLPTFTPTLLPTETATASRVPTNTPTNPPPTNTPLPADTATPVVSDVPISELVLGEEAMVVGTVVGTSSFSQGFKFVLDDGSGRVTLLMWHNVYDDAWDAPSLNIGATVRATGLVGEFEGELQIVPDWGGGVQVLVPAGAFATAQNIGDLGNHVGQLVSITGQVVRLEGSGSGVNVFVADDTGETAVFIWNNVFERIPNNSALNAAGTTVQVVGWVQLFRSNRQVVPALPYDIVVGGG